MRCARPIRHIVLAATLVACARRPAPSPAPAGDGGYTAYVSGSGTDVSTAPAGGMLLAGGGTDSDAGMAWLLAQGGEVAPGRRGDVVVLRASGGDGYNAYLLKLGANSVTSIVITSVAGANSAWVRDRIAHAEVVFLAGGDQSRYVRYWAGTALQAAVNARVAAGYPIGGTSAGLAVLGEHIYSANFESTVSAQALANPYDSTLTFARRLFDLPLLRNVITDSHFVVRNRLGRTLAFLARLQQDGAAQAPRALAVDEASAVGVDRDGCGTVFGAPRSAGAYMFAVDPDAARTVAPATPLSLGPVRVLHVPVGGSLDVRAWTAPAVAPYVISARSGTLSSSSGAIY